MHWRDPERSKGQRRVKVCPSVLETSGGYIEEVLEELILLVASEGICTCEKKIRDEKKAKRRRKPSDEFVENLDVFFQVIDLRRISRIEDSKGRDGSSIVDIASAWLEETANEDDFEECICILEKLKSGTCLD
jgi:hypothetical protein